MVSVKQSVNSKVNLGLSDGIAVAVVVDEEEVDVVSGVAAGDGFSSLGSILGIND